MRKIFLFTALLAAGWIAAGVAVQAQSYNSAAGPGMHDNGSLYGRRDEMFGGSAFNPNFATGPNSSQGAVKKKAASHRRGERKCRKETEAVCN